jgi:hypothetical protein
MNTNTPQEIQDAVNAMIQAFKDLKANKASSLLGDELPLIMKLSTELAALKADLTLKGALEAAEYLIGEIITVGV